MRAEAEHLRFLGQGDAGGAVHGSSGGLRVWRFREAGRFSGLLGTGGPAREHLEAVGRGGADGCGRLTAMSGGALVTN
jgi:hypothetical protein